MSAPTLDGIVAIGVDILNADRDNVTSSTLLQTGDVVTGQVESDRVESWQHAGFASIPSNPVPGQAACQGIVWKRGDFDVCTNTRDMRGQEIAGLLAAGETCVYAGGTLGTAQGRLLCKANGAVTMYTTSDNTLDGKSVYFRVAPDGFEWVAPWGTMKFNDTGFHILHSSGARIDLGGIYGMPAPLDEIASYINLQAGTIKKTSSACSHGVGVVFPLANATAIQTALTAIATALTAIGAAADLAPSGGGAGAAAATAAASALAAAALLVPTTSSSTL